MTPSLIAKVCHEANRAYSHLMGDYTHRSWEESPQWQRDSAIEGVRYVLANPCAPPWAMHDAWLARKRAQGWHYGPVKNEALKEHPDYMPYGQLPAEERQKDVLFKAIVLALKE